MNSLQTWITENLIQSNGQLNSRKVMNDGNWIQENAPDMYKQINEHNGRTISEKLHLIMNNLEEPPLCLECKKNYVPFWGFRRGYNTYKFCSNKCARNNEQTSNKMKETMKEKYGVEHALQSTEILEKVKATNKKRFGHEWAAQNEEVKIKIIEANKLSVDKRIEAVKKTNREKYGVDFWFQTNECKEAQKNSYMQKYGVEHYTQTEEYKQKTVETNNARYGANYHWQNPQLTAKYSQKRREDNYEKFIQVLKENEYELLSSKEEYNKIGNLLKVKCLKCSTEFQTSDYASCIKCKCRRLGVRSNEEKELFEWLQSICNEEVIHSAKNIINPFELDIYIPSKKLAVEFDGLWFHSEEHGKRPNYHLRKTEMCEEKGIRLIHVFENEWIEKKEIVKSILKSSIGIFDKRIYARKCEIRKIASKQYAEFVLKNHIQGYAVAPIRLGLFYENELVAVMSFGKSRFKTGELEVIRFCTQLNTQIIGGFSKLLKYFLTNCYHKNLVSYCDRRYFTGYGYMKNGFEFVEYTKPNYWYWKQGGTLESRIRYQKKRLAKKLETFDENLTEVQNMRLNGFSRIFDCGNIKLRYTE